jgi:hypothetical protein
MSQPPPCGFDGNPDLYGLGIRTGVYLQWVSALIIWRWYPEGRTELGGAYLVFLFALLIAMIVTTARLEPIHSAEILLLMYIIFGGVFTVMSIGLRKSHLQKVKKMKGSLVQATALSFILAAASIYCSWFWLFGIHHDFLDTQCGTYGFLFTKVSLKNEHVTKFFAALSMYLAIIYGGVSVYILAISVLFLMKVPSAMRAVRRLKPTPKDVLEMGDQVRSDSQRYGHNSGAQDSKILSIPLRKRLTFSSRKNVPNDRRDVMASIIMPTANVVSLIYSVIGIEMTLQWNHVTGVYSINSVGQLIPFVIGLAGFVKVIYEPLKDVSLILSILQSCYQFQKV